MAFQQARNHWQGSSPTKNNGVHTQPKRKRKRKYIYIILRSEKCQPTRQQRFRLDRVHTATHTHTPSTYQKRTKKNDEVRYVCPFLLNKEFCFVPADCKVSKAVFKEHNRPAPFIVHWKTTFSYLTQCFSPTLVSIETIGRNGQTLFFLPLALRFLTWWSHRGVDRSW